MNRTPISTCLLLTSFIALAACQSTNSPTQGPQTATFLTHNWQLIPAESQLSFVSTKNKTFTEQHTLQYQEGTLDRAQQLEVVLDLNSVDTLIPIRDERMRNILFKTDQYPVATITASIPQDMALNVPVTLPFVLNLHGQQRNMNATVLAEVIENQLVVINYEPVALNTRNFGMDGAINQLTQIAGLQSIDYASLIEFKLVFEK